ncbi:MAG: hypothetical protein ISR76_08105 [Planctomycetes bacterium]|nr:hypothetical protein [Planctomycetota bacterium]MBL7008946.1 hypothetical protein [Planctomycetota bacterium]
MSLRKLLRSSLLPAAALTLGLGFTLPASGAATVYGPAPGGEGCSLFFESPNEFYCVGPCSGGEECSAEALVIQEADGGVILRCGTDCPSTLCLTEWQITPDGSLKTRCRNEGCSSCLLNQFTKLCGCTE